jgi:phosphatidyl-myo-inositol dimannoside synthase
MKSSPRLGLIAYEYPPLVGGMATYAHALAAHMQSRGWEVHVMANTLSRPGDGGIADVHPFLTTDLARDLPRLARHEVDLWHSINFGYAPLAMCRRPFVLTVHGNDFLNPWVRPTMDRVPFLWRTSRLVNQRSVRRALYPFALRCVDHVMTCSRFSMERFRREYRFGGPMTVVPNGVPDDFLSGETPGAHISRHPRRLLTVCNLETANWRKNIDGCLRAVALLADCFDLEYWIVGEGRARPQLEQLADRLGIAARVRFLGRVDDLELRRAYASSSLFVLVPRPRAVDVEGFGIVYIEAAAHGTPSLAGCHGGASDAVVEGRTGFFARDASPEAIAEALARFFDGRLRFDADLVRKHADEHRWSKVLTEVEAIYERALTGRSTRRSFKGKTYCQVDGGTAACESEPRASVSCDALCAEYR